MAMTAAPAPPGPVTVRGPVLAPGPGPARRRRRATRFGLEVKKPYPDGVITGRGTVEERTVRVYVDGFPVVGGAPGEAHAAKTHKIMAMAIAAAAMGMAMVIAAAGVAEGRCGHPCPGGSLGACGLRRLLAAQLQGGRGYRFARAARETCLAVVRRLLFALPHNSREGPPRVAGGGPGDRRRAVPPVLVPVGGDRPDGMAGAAGERTAASTSGQWRVPGRQTGPAWWTRKARPMPSSAAAPPGPPAPGPCVPARPPAAAARTGCGRLPGDAACRPAGPPSRRHGNPSQ